MKVETLILLSVLTVCVIPTPAADPAVVLLTLTLAENAGAVSAVTIVLRVLATTLGLRAAADAQGRALPRFG